MTQNVQTLNWARTTQNGTYVASVKVDAGVDLDWSIHVTDRAPDTERAIAPNFITIDNSSNASPITVSYGPLTFTVHEYERQVFSLPGSAILVTIHINGGQTLVYFSEERYADPSANQFGINKATAAVLEFPTIAVIASRAQQAADFAAYLEFAGGSPLTYSLLDTTTNVVPNGSVSFIKNDLSATLAIVPATGQNIDNIYTHAAPLYLLPGDNGVLVCDGTNWSFAGFKPRAPLIGVAAGRAQLVSDFGAYVEFTGAAAITYTLLNTSTTVIPNGSSSILKNETTAVVTVTATGGHTIDGAASIYLLPGENGVLTCDGTNWSFAGFMARQPVIGTGATRAQTISDFGGFVSFTGIAAIVYSLLDTSATVIPNGAASILKNNSTAIALVTAAGAQTIDGAASVALFPGDSGVLVCNGTNWSFTRADATPAGAIMPFAMNTAPAGWLAADGSAVSRTTYAALFAQISTNYGAGDGVTTFNLPDLRGYFLRGAGTNGDGAAAGAFGTKVADSYLNHSHGTTEVAHTHTVTDAGHTHTITDAGHNHTHTDPGHTHAHNVNTNSVTSGGGSGQPVTGTGALTTGSSTTGVTNNPATTGITNNTATTGVTNNTASTGLTVNASTTGGTETKPKNIAMLYCIKT